jgi:hypothetical protein
MSAMLLMSALAFSQIEKGKVQLSGSLLFNNTENDITESTNFNINALAGYFLSDNTSLGLNLGINNRNTENPGGDTDLNIFTVGAYARFHKPVVDNFYLFLQPELSFGSGSIENGANTTDINTTALGVSPGAVYFLSPSFALEMRVGSLQYNRFKETNNGNDVTTSTFGLNLNLTGFALGASFYL